MSIEISTLDPIRCTNLLQGYTTTATSGGTTILTNASTHTQYFTGSSAHTLQLPAANTLVDGYAFTVVNRSSGAVTVQSSVPTTVHVVGSGGEYMFTCIDDTASTGIDGWWSMQSGFNTPPVDTVMDPNSSSSKYPTSLSKGVWYGLDTYDNAFGATNVTLGQSAGTGAANAIAIGTSASAGGSSSIALGQLTSAAGTNAIVIGNSSKSGLGQGNLMLGHNGGTSIGTGSYNIGIGYETLRSNRVGEYNIAIGYHALLNTQAGANVAIGGNAGSNLGNIAYTDGTGASQSGTTITGVGTSWRADMVGGTIVFSTGEMAPLTTFVSPTSFTSAVSQTVASTSYAIYSGFVYNTGTVEQSGVTLTGTGTIFDSLMVGGYIVFQNSQTFRSSQIVGYTSATVLTLADSQTVTAGETYKIYYALAIANTFLGTNAAAIQIAGRGNTIVGETAAFQMRDASFNTIVGHDAARWISTGGDNTITGTAAANTITTGGGNVVNGFEAGRLLSTGNYNTITGYRACYNLGGNSFTTAYGSSAGYSINTGIHNALFGTNAGITMTTGSHNAIFGTNAGYTTNGSYNVIFGSEAGHDMTSGSQNVILGYNAGITMTTGSGNVISGHEAGHFMSTGSGCTVIGNYAGFNMGGSVADNVLIGAQTGESVTSSYNTVVGTGAGRYARSGANNVMVGHNAGYIFNSSGNNVAVGYHALQSATSGPNVAVGSNAGGKLGNSAYSTGTASQSGTTITGVGTNWTGDLWGGRIVFSTGETADLIGPYSATSWTSTVSQTVASTTYTIYQGYSHADGTVTQSSFTVTGTGTTFTDEMVGGYIIYTGAVQTYQALRILEYVSATSIKVSGTQTVASSTYVITYNKPTRNTIIGTNAALNHYDGSNNIVIGDNAAAGLKWADDNVIVGTDAGNRLTNGYFNIFTGTRAGYNMQVADNNIAIGHEALYGSIVPTNGYNNIGIGREAGYNIATGEYNTMCGQYAGQNITGGSYNVLVGSRCGNHIGGGGANVMIGTSAGGRVNGNNNVAIGEYALLGYALGNANCSNNIAIGSMAGTNVATSSANNIMIGTNAGSNITTSINNVLIGFEAGKTMGAGATANVCVGANSGYAITTGDFNTCVGTDSGSLITTGKWNLAAGYGAGGNLATGDENVLVGHDAGLDLTSGTTNVAIGPAAGTGISTADDNVMIGRDTSVSSSLIAGAVAIGAGITADYSDGFFVKHRHVVGVINPAGFEANRTELVETTSSRRFKDNIRDLDDVSSKFDQLRPVRYVPKEGHGEYREHIGLIAEEVNELFPEIVTYEHDTGVVLGLMMDRLVPVLIREVKLLKQKSAEQDLLINELRGRLA